MRERTRHAALTLTVAAFAWIIFPGLATGSAGSRVIASGLAATAGSEGQVGKAPRRESRAAATTRTSTPVEVAPGAVVRWSVPGTRSCGMAGRTWKAVGETCYFPIDVEHKPDVVTVTRRGARGSIARARISVLAASFNRENIDLGDIPQAHPSAADLRRNAREQARSARIWRRPEGPARFTLPLGSPLAPLPEGKGFGAEWIFNSTPPSRETHAGLDFAAGAGTSVAAMADGTVVLAEDLFYSGNSVFVDHGNGLYSAYLHLSEIKVRAGEEVRRGESIGVVGGTGRTTGPHLHLAVRWHRARIDPRLLMQDPAKLPAVGER